MQPSTALQDEANSSVKQKNLGNDRDSNKNLDLLILIPRMPDIYGSQLSNGPLVLASFFESKGYSAKIFDNNSRYRFYTDKELLEKIAHESPSIIGLSVTMLSAFNSYRLLRAIKKKFPDKIVIAGGMHTYDAIDEVAEQGFDVTFSGESEVSLLKFMDLVKRQKGPIDLSLLKNKAVLSELRSIPGLVMKHEDKLINTGPVELIADLDELPPLNRELLNLDDFIKSQADHHAFSTTSLNFQRGCPFECTFCKADFMGGKIRNNSADYIVETIQRIHDQYGLKHFHLTDSNFTIDKSRVVEFCNKMISNGLSKKVGFWVQTSITTSLKDEELALFKKAGLVTISFGVERFSPDFRELMVKAGSQQQVFEVLKRIKKHGIKTDINILINHPADTAESLKIEASYLDKALPWVDFYRINYLVPVPGTPIWEAGKGYDKWYLNEKIVGKITSYYDHAFNITSPGLEFNLFNRGPEVVKANRKFKEKYYIKSLSRLKSAPFIFGSTLFKCVLALDILAAKISYFLYNFSPRLEHFIFWPLKVFRESGAKFFIVNWFYFKDPATKINDSDVELNPYVDRHVA